MEEVEQLRETVEDTADGARDMEAEIHQSPNDESPNHDSIKDSSPRDLFIAEAASEPAPAFDSLATLKAVIEAAIYITDEPLKAEQIASAVGQPLDRVNEILRQLVDEYSAPDRGLSVRELAGGYKMATKPEHHETIRLFVVAAHKSLR
jgi:segregation and condensation protein B